MGVKGSNTDVSRLSEITYLLESSSDRIGALDFQQSPTNYVGRNLEEVTLDELFRAVEFVETGRALPLDLDAALLHGSSIGGARPKATLNGADKKWIAKFSSHSDLYNVIKSEYVAMRMARLVGLDVASVRLASVAKKDVLLIERFDRIRTGNGWTRRAMVSALTILGLDEMLARYASYETLADTVRMSFSNPKETLRELFGRLSFNIICGNTDDHARNHAAFWDGKELTLTPAYDICPQGRSGGEAIQAMFIHGENRMSRLSVCIEAAHRFLLKESEAKELIDHQLEITRTNWKDVCDEASLSERDRDFLWGRQFMSPFILT